MLDLGPIERRANNWRRTARQDPAISGVRLLCDETLSVVAEDRDLRAENAKLKADAAAMRAAGEKAYDHASIHSSGTARNVCALLKAALSGDAGRELLKWAKKVSVMEIDGRKYHLVEEPPEWLK